MPYLCRILTDRSLLMASAIFSASASVPEAGSVGGCPGIMKNEGLTDCSTGLARWQEREDRGVDNTQPTDSDDSSRAVNHRK